MIRAMDADAIHREVVRRLKLVEELHLRENVLTLFNSHIKNYPGWREKDPEYMYPQWFLSGSLTVTALDYRLK